MANIFAPEGMNYNDIDEKKISWSSSMRHGDKCCQWQWLEQIFPWGPEEEGQTSRRWAAKGRRWRESCKLKVHSFVGFREAETEAARQAKWAKERSEIWSGDRAIRCKTSFYASIWVMIYHGMLVVQTLIGSSWVNWQKNSFVTVGQEAAESLKRDADVDRKKIEVWRYQSINSMVCY